MGMFEVSGFGRPVKLLVGGLHGNEGKTTAKVLQEMSGVKVEKGSVVLCDLSKKSKYVSTLNPVYYDTGEGKRLLSAIRRFKPEIYIELHSYNSRNYEKLTDPFRRLKAGVPPFIELKNGILLGSVSPNLRTQEFTRNDFCLSVEIPSNLSDPSILIDLLIMTIKSGERCEILSNLRIEYPSKIRRAERWFYRFHGNPQPF